MNHRRRNSSVPRRKDATPTSVRSPQDEVGAEGGQASCVDDSHLAIRGPRVSVNDGGRERIAGPDPGTLPEISIETRYGWDIQVAMAAPVFLGVPGSTKTAWKGWEHVAKGAALAGVTLVCGDNVCGLDPLLELGPRREIRAAPELDRRISAYRQYHRAQGELLVQMNVEDARLGLAEYLIENHGLETIELKWGHGTAYGDGEIKIESLDWALELQRRGFHVIPDPSNPVIQAAFRTGAIQQFERHQRMGFFDEEKFLALCDRLRRLGFKRITLHAGACGPRELALALKWGSKARLDLVTFGSVSERSGRGPRRAGEERAMANFVLHVAAVQCADRLVAKGQRVPDLAFAGGFDPESSIFKALALGSPYVKAVCIGQDPDIQGPVARSTGIKINGGSPSAVHSPPETLPEIFTYGDELAGIVGKDEMARLPLGAIGVYAWIRKLGEGLRQTMAEARCGNLASIRRRDATSLARASADVAGLPNPTEAFCQEAEAILGV